MSIRLLTCIAIFLFVIVSASSHVVDVMLVNYPNQPYTGTNAGNLDGTVVDGSQGPHLAIVGASVCFITNVNNPGCEATNSTGGFLFQNVAAGQYAIQVTASGFYSSPLITVQVSTGELSHAGQIGLQPVGPPWYTEALPLILVSIVAIAALIVSCVLAYKVRSYRKAPKTPDRN